MKHSRILKVYQLPEESASQQHYVDRAEEDLFTAVCLFRQGICGVVPYNVICFLLHQATEKWLKVFVAIVGLPLSNPRTHELRLLFDCAKKEEGKFYFIKVGLEKADESMLEHSFHSNIRYNDTHGNVEDCTTALRQAAFATRRLAKRWLTDRQRREESWQVELNFQGEVLTPMFIGGADTSGNPELRAPSVRGTLLLGSGACGWYSPGKNSCDDKEEVRKGS